MSFTKKRTLLSKFIGSILIVSILSPLFYFSAPKKAEAQWPVFDIPTEAFTGISSVANVTQITKDIGLDSLAWIAAKMVIRKITAQTVNWINTGFEGSPAYITNPSQFFTNVGDQMAGKVLSQTSLSKLCTPFQANIRIALVKNYLQETDYSYYNTCTLGMIEQNFENFTNNFSGNGGWDTFFQVTQNSQNNPYGAYLNTKNQLYAQIGTQSQKYTKQLEWGKGLLSYERCKPGTELKNRVTPSAGEQVATGTITKECVQWSEATVNDPEIRCIAYKSQVATSNMNQQEKVDVGMNVGDCTPDNKETVTPGTVIEGQMQNVFGSSIKQLEMADEINEIISALLAQLTDALIGGIGKGLRGLTQKTTTQQRTFVDQISQGSPETIKEDSQATSTIADGVTDFSNQVQETSDTVKASAPSGNTPVLVLNGDSPMYVSAGTNFVDPGAKAFDPVTNTEYTVLSTDIVDTQISGDKWIEYYFRSDSGVSASPVSRQVIVQ